jgi:Phosphohistidine phosphatase SixA
MKRLTLLRHAKSGWDDPVSRDFDRPVNMRGKKAAEVIGRWLRDQRISFDYIASSPAVRCVETIDHLSIGYGETMTPVWDRRAYLASGSSLLDIVHEAPENSERMLLVGHNPGLEDLILSLVPDVGGDDTRDAVEEKFPTASLVEIDFDVDAWDAIRPGGGKLVYFKRPRDLDPALGPGAA